MPGTASASVGTVDPPGVPFNQTVAAASGRDPRSSPGIFPSRSTSEGRMTPTVRPARAEDWPSIRALLAARALPIDGAQGHVADFLVATNAETGAVVGVAGLERYGGLGLVRSVAVAEDVAAQG